MGFSEQTDTVSRWYWWAVAHNNSIQFILYSPLSQISLRGLYNLYTHDIPDLWPHIRKNSQKIEKNTHGGKKTSSGEQQRCSQHAWVVCCELVTTIGRGLHVLKSGRRFRTEGFWKCQRISRHSRGVPDPSRTIVKHTEVSRISFIHVQPWALLTNIHLRVFLFQK